MAAAGQRYGADKYNDHLEHASIPSFLPAAKQRSPSGSDCGEGQGSRFDSEAFIPQHHGAIRFIHAPSNARTNAPRASGAITSICNSRSGAERTNMPSTTYCTPK